MLTVTMGESNKALYSKMIVDVVIGPVLERLEKKDISVAQTLRAAFAKCDNALPGFTYDYMRGMLRKGDIHDRFDMCATLLYLGGSQDSEELKINRPEPTFQELSRCATALKKILSRIPEQIYNRKQFLETIKEIASAIKRLLDAVNRVIAEVPSTDNGSKQILEERKKEFVRYSKRFSNTLKDFFRDNNQSYFHEEQLVRVSYTGFTMYVSERAFATNQSVFISANYLIYQTNVILRCVKNECC